MIDNYFVPIVGPLDELWIEGILRLQTPAQGDLHAIQYICPTMGGVKTPGRPDDRVNLDRIDKQGVLTLQFRRPDAAQEREQENEISGFVKKNSPTEGAMDPPGSYSISNKRHRLRIGCYFALVRVATSKITAAASTPARTMYW